MSRQGPSPSKQKRNAYFPQQNRQLATRKIQMKSNSSQVDTDLIMPPKKNTMPLHFIVEEEIRNQSPLKYFRDHKKKNTLFQLGNKFCETPVSSVRGQLKYKLSLKYNQKGRIPKLSDISDNEVLNQRYYKYNPLKTQRVARPSIRIGPNEVKTESSKSYLSEKFQYKYNQNTLNQTSSTSTTVKKIPNLDSTTRIKSQKNSQPKSQNMKLEDFKIIKKIGKGKFGTVFMVKHNKTGFIAALKIVKKQQIIQQKLVNQFVRQLKIHAYLSHPNIIDFYGFFEDKLCIYLLLELGCQGQLYSRLKQKQSYSEEATSFIAKNLLEAIAYMHDRQIIHRDIKPQNIIITHGIVKLCDFGWAVQLTKELRTTFCGTPLYVSPQILAGQSYDEKIDIWSIGILVYQLLIGETPFKIKREQDLTKIITDIVTFPKYHKLSLDCRQFVLKILKKDPNQRLNAEELLRHNYIKKYEAFQTCEQLCQN